MFQKATQLEVLTVEEGADLLRVTREDVERLIADRRLPAQDIYGQWRILKVVVYRWLAAQHDINDILEFACAFRDDPDLEAMTAEIYRERGCSLIEV